MKSGTTIFFHNHVRDSQRRKGGHFEERKLWISVKLNHHFFFLLKKGINLVEITLLETKHNIHAQRNSYRAKHISETKIEKSHGNLFCII